MSKYFSLILTLVLLMTSQKARSDDSDLLGDYQYVGTEDGFQDATLKIEERCWLLPGLAIELPGSLGFCPFRHKQLSLDFRLYWPTRLLLNLDNPEVGADGIWNTHGSTVLGCPFADVPVKMGPIVKQQFALALYLPTHIESGCIVSAFEWTSLT